MPRYQGSFGNAAATGSSCRTALGNICAASSRASQMLRAIYPRRLIVRVAGKKPRSVCCVCSRARRAVLIPNGSPIDSTL